MPAVSRTVLAVQAAERIGFPEARIPLADSVIELCLSPKSNSGILAIDSALSDIKNGNYGSIPNHLKDAHYKGAKNLGHGTTYKYPHDYPHDWVKQDYLPQSMKNKQYYYPKENGSFETSLSQQYHRLKKAQNK